MRVVIQRVTHAKVTVNDKITGKINHGLLIFCGFENEDSLEDFEWMSNKITQLRIFNDEKGVMNISLQDTKGEILLVSQFTLHASTKKGNRPSYIKASKPELAKNQYNIFKELLSKKNSQPLQSGIFGADMKVELLNDGPVTIYIDSKNKE